MPYASSEDPSNPIQTNTHQTSPRLANLVLLWQPIQYKAYIIWKHITLTTLALASMTTWAILFELVISVLIPTTQKKNLQNQRTEHKGHCNTGSGRWQEDVSVMTICDECRHFHDDMWRAHAWPFFSEERWMLTRVAKSLMLHWSQMAPLHCAAQFHRGRAEWNGEELDKGVSDTRQSADTETRPKIQITFIGAQLSIA